MVNGYEPIDEEVVGEEVEEVEEPLEIAGEVEEPVYEMLTPSGIRRYERSFIVSELCRYALNDLMGYVYRRGRRWFITGAPGIPVRELVFESDIPPINSYIRVTRWRMEYRSLGRRNANSFRHVVVVLDWEYTKPPKIKPPMSFKDFHNSVLDGVEFVNKSSEILYVYNLIGSPFIVISGEGVKIYGGARMAFLGRYSTRINRVVKELMTDLPKPYRYINNLYRGLKGLGFIVISKYF